MKPSLNSFRFALLLSIMVCLSSTLARVQNVSRTAKPLATQTVNLSEETEVGLDIEARSPGASWAREHAEAAALQISVDGIYNQDLLLWAGEEFFHYRVMIGRLKRGPHTISVSLNKDRSAADAQRAEVKSVRPLLLTPENKTANADEERWALANSPMLYARANTIDRFTDLPLLMYYETLRDAGDLIVRYTAIFTNEDGGTRTAALMARWGRATDIEWVYQFRVRGGRITEEIYQGVEHETKPFTGPRASGNHPLLAVASDNNNFSDLACSSVRYAPLPIRAHLETATRESVMDTYPQTYRVMTEELLREKRISDTPLDINTIADPREYLYIEAGSEEDGTALAFDVKIDDQSTDFASDMGDPRLRIDRSGNFRTAVRLPKGILASQVETVTAKCHSTASQFVGDRGCKHLKLLRALMLDKNYTPQTLSLKPQDSISLAPGETKVFRMQQ